MMVKSIAIINLFKITKFLGVFLSPRAFLKSYIILLKVLAAVPVEDTDDIEKSPLLATARSSYLLFLSPSFYQLCIFWPELTFELLLRDCILLPFEPCIPLGIADCILLPNKGDEELLSPLTS